MKLTFHVCLDKCLPTFHFVTHAMTLLQKKIIALRSTSIFDPRELYQLTYFLHKTYKSMTHYTIKHMSSKSLHCNYK
jgi:hypothetical protein